MKHTQHRLLVIAAVAMLVIASAPTWAQRGRRGGAKADVFEVDPATAGTIKGRVVLKGDTPPPPEKPIRMDADPTCAAAHEGMVMTEKFKVSEDGGVANVFVYISKGLEGKTFAVPEEEAVLDQVGCIYIPTVWGMQVDQTLRIKNSDPTLHNVHALTDDKDLFNLAMPTKDMEIKQTFRDEAVMVKVKCDVHPWMFAYVGVLDHPYFAVTDEDGYYEIKNVPPGEYKVSAWQERGLRKRRTTNVGPGETVEKQNLSFTFDKKKKK